jgi:hypothetical protein
MRLRNTSKFMAAAIQLALAPAVLAHDGHGLGGNHWHASDTAGFITVAVLAAAALWLSRK